MSAGTDSNNRRNYFRQPMYQRVNIRVAGVRVTIPATLIDISGGGCLLHARTMLKPQTIIEFDLNRPGQPVLRLGGILRKVTYTASDRTFRYAVGWNAVDSDAHDQLLKFIVEEQRRTIKGTREPKEEDLSLSAKPQVSTKIQEMRAHHRVDVNFPVRYTLRENPGVFNATAVDVSTGGCRIIVEQVLRQEWLVKVTFTLPNEALRTAHQVKGATAAAMTPFTELQMMARPLPGIKHSRGRYVQSLSWIAPDPLATQEISRFIQAVKLGSHKRR